MPVSSGSVYDCRMRWQWSVGAVLLTVILASTAAKDSATAGSVSTEDNDKWEDRSDTSDDESDEEGDIEILPGHRLILHEEQLQMIAAATQQPVRPHAGHRRIHQQAAFERQRKLLQSMHRCVAANCAEQLRECSNHGAACLEPLMKTMDGGIECAEESQDDDVPHDIVRILQRLLICLKVQCKHPQQELPLWESQPGLVTQQEIAQILQLKQEALDEADTAGLERGNMQEFRTFGWSDLSEAEKQRRGLGHTVNFLHRIIQQRLPDLLQRLRQAVVAADKKMGWLLGSRFALREEDYKLRVAELIQYDGKNASHSWSMQNDSYGCSLVSEGSTPALLNSSEAGLSLAECKGLCERTSGCVSVDWNTTTCQLLNKGCNYPAAPSQASYLLASVSGQLGTHADAGSLLSLSVALTDPSTYSGGELHFCAVCSDRVHVERPEVGGVTIWPSGYNHGVSPITSGSRKVLVLEFWEFCSNPDNRTDTRPWSDGLATDCVISNDTTNANQDEPDTADDANQDEPDAADDANQDETDAADDASQDEPDEL